MGLVPVGSRDQPEEETGLQSSAPDPNFSSVWVCTNPDSARSRFGPAAKFKYTNKLPDVSRVFGPGFCSGPILSWNLRFPNTDLITSLQTLFLWTLMPIGLCSVRYQLEVTGKGSFSNNQAALWIFTPHQQLCQRRGEGGKNPLASSHSRDHWSAVKSHRL